MTKSKFSKPGHVKDYTRPTARAPKFWSFSRLSQYEKCPMSFAMNFIWKLPQDPKANKAMERGNKIHKQSEDYLNGKLKGIPQPLMQFREEYAAVRKMGAVAEQTYTVTKTWQPTVYDDWDHAWLRAKVDIEIINTTLTIVDLKTGRSYPEHEDQAGIYGTLALIQHPTFDEIDFEYWYADSGEVGHYEFTRPQLRGMKKTWRERANKMLKAKVFKATPGDNACRFCPYRSDREQPNGEPGPCALWK